MEKTWKRHSAKEIIGKLERAGDLVTSGVAVEVAAAAIGVSDARYFRWRKQYSGLRSSQLVYIKELETEVSRLRRAIKEFDGRATG